MTYEQAVCLKDTAIFAAIYLKGGKKRAKRIAELLEADQWHKFAIEVKKHYTTNL